MAPSLLPSPAFTADENDCFDDIDDDADIDALVDLLFPDELTRSA